MLEIEYKLFEWLDDKIGYNKSEIIFSIYLWIITIIVVLGTLTLGAILIYLAWTTNNQLYSILAGGYIGLTFVISGGYLNRIKERKKCLKHYLTKTKL